MRGKNQELNVISDLLYWSIFQEMLLVVQMNQGADTEVMVAGACLITDVSSKPCLTGERGGIGKSCVTKFTMLNLI